MKKIECKHCQHAVELLNKLFDLCEERGRQIRELAATIDNETLRKQNALDMQAIAQLRSASKWVN